MGKVQRIAGTKMTEILAAGPRNFLALQAAVARCAKPVGGILSFFREASQHALKCATRSNADSNE